MGTNTGKGYRKGQQRNRYQQENLLSKLFDLFDGNGNYLRTKKSKGKFKGASNAQSPSAVVLIKTSGLVRSRRISDAITRAPSAVSMCLIATS